MSYDNFQFTERLMQLRVEDELRRAKLSRLQSETRAACPGWRSRLRWLARTLRVQRWRREDHSLRETLVPHKQTHPAV